MRTGVIVLATALAACAAAQQPSGADQDSQERCWFSMDSLTPCRIDHPKLTAVVTIEAEPVASDEILLQSLAVKQNGVDQVLEVSDDTTLIEGDRGFISVQDINFDSIPDLAITTSFGVANLYLDYWVYDAAKEKYIRVGNFPLLEVDEGNKTLHSVEKINAANYEEKTWRWGGTELQQVD